MKLCRVGLWPIFACLWAGCSSKPVATALPQRIVSVTITGDVLLQAMVDPSRVLAVTCFADDSGIHEAAGCFPKAPRIKADLEKILALRPDLVLVSTFHDPSFLEGLARSGISTEVLFDPTSIPRLRQFILHLAKRVGSQAKGDSLVHWMDSVLAMVHDNRGTTQPISRVLYWSDGFTSGDSTTIGDLIQVAGFRNAAAEAGWKGSHPISVEDVLRINPDWLLRPSWEGGSKQPLPAALMRLDAVKQGRVATVPGRWVLSTSHRCALGALAIQQSVHH